MKRWLKRILIAVLLLVVVLVGGAGVAYWRANRVPSWYAAANKVDPEGSNAVIKQQLIPMNNWVNRTTAGNLDEKPPEAKRFTTELTADQLNALLINWSDAAGVRERIGEHLKNIRVRLADGKITIAGESVEYERILSIVIQPGVSKDGYTQLALDSIQIGDQTLPLVALDGQKKSLNRGLLGRAGGAADKLSIDDRGIASRETASLYYTSLVANLFSGQPADMYAFLGHDLSMKNTVATRVKELKVNEGSLSLTLEMLSPSQRKALVDQLKAAATPPTTQP